VAFFLPFPLCACTSANRNPASSRRKPRQGHISSSRVERSHRSHIDCRQIFSERERTDAGLTPIFLRKHILFALEIWNCRGGG